MTKTKQTWLVIGIVLFALVLDQVSKVYIKTLPLLLTGL